MPRVREIMNRIDPDVPIRRPGQLIDNVNARLFQPRFYATVLAGFAGLALLLAAVGLYGLVSFQVAQRRRELGIRMAIGASQAGVVRHIAGVGLRPAMLGVAIGSIGAFAATRFIASLLFDVRVLDPVTWIAVATVMLAVVAAASVIPARRAARIDPAISLRAD